jgi:hypothetical protein
LKHATILDARGKGRVIYIRNANPIIEGLMITGGDASGLGGTPYGDAAGGGIYVYSGAPVFRHNIITENYSPWDGGGIYLRYVNNAELIGNTITNNQAKYGGGVYIWASKITLQDNIIEANSVTGGGGGIWMGVYSEATINQNTISANSAEGEYAANGGGMRAERCSLHFERNLVMDNQVFTGGGISLDRCNATVVNNLFLNNSVHTVGGGLYLEGSNASLIHNTFSGNSGAESSGIYVNTDDAGRTCNATLFNNIIVAHDAGVYVTSGNQVDINATLWGAEEWENGIDWAGDGSIEIGSINIWGDPVFLAPASQDYHIMMRSPAKDAGIETKINSDIDGDCRPFGSNPDLGFDEWTPNQETICYPSELSFSRELCSTQTCEWSELDEMGSGVENAIHIYIPFIVR